MVAQISDRILYDGGLYHIAGVNGAELFRPQDHGLEVAAFSRACDRGFHCSYAVVDETLRLNAVSLGLLGKDSLVPRVGLEPLLFGKAPVPREFPHDTVNSHTGEGLEKWIYTEHCVDGLNEAVAYTGGILIGAELIRKLDVQVGFHPAWAYATVHELRFDSGHLIRATDCSEQMAEFREMLTNRPLRPPIGTPTKEVLAWIANRYQQNYKM